MNLYADVSEHCLFHLHRQGGVKNETGLRNFEVFIRGKVWLEPIPQHFSNLFHFSHLPTYEYGTDRVFRNVGI
jgi:hypothetical protein